MIRIARPRGEGKTTDLVIYSHNTGYPIVCTNLCGVRACKMRAAELGYSIPEPIEVRELSKFLSGRNGAWPNSKYNAVLVDDIEYAFQELLGATVAGFTVSTRE